MPDNKRCLSPLRNFIEVIFFMDRVEFLEQSFICRSRKTGSNDNVSTFTDRQECGLDFNEKWIFLTDFLKIPKYQISWKSIQLQQPGCFTQTQTDMTKLLVALHNFANAPTNVSDKICKEYQNSCFMYNRFVSKNHTIYEESGKILYSQTSHRQ